MSSRSVTDNLPSNSYFNDKLQPFLENPWLFLLQLFLTVCLITRGATGLWSRLQPVPVNQFNVGTIPRVPYWIPFIGHQLSFSLRKLSWLLNLAHSYKPGIFTITLLGHKYHVLASTDLIAALQQQQSARSMTSTRYRILRNRRFFANRWADESTITRIDAASSAYTTDNSKLNRLCDLLEANSYNLISPSRSWIDQAAWERSADIQVLSPATAKPSKLCVSASMPVLIREFTGYVVLSAIVGSSFLDSSPGFIGDFFAFGKKYEYFMTGWPYWIVPGLGPPALAREKCLLALESLVEALLAEMEGGIGARGGDRGMSGLFDLDDVHRSIQQLVREAWKEARKVNRSRRATLREITSEILEVLWLASYDATTMVVWALIEIYHSKNKNLNDTVREEVTEMIHIEKPKATGLPIEDLPRLQLKTKARRYFGDIQHLCPALSGVLLEAERLKTWLEEYLDASEDFVLYTDSSSPTEAKDQQPRGERKGLQIKKGDRLCIAHGVANRDQYHWQSPGAFDVIAEQASDAHPGAMQGVFSSRIGNNDKTGIRSQVEKIHYMVAAIVSMYNFEAMDEGLLKEPSSSVIAGMVVPSDSYRVRISRRLLE